MDPPSYTEAFPLNGGETLPTHTPGPPMVPYTTVNMSRERPPRDHIIWSLLSFLYCFPCCLGLAAVIYSVKARDSKMRGDFRSAVHHGAIARNINIGAIILFLILVGVIIYLFFYQSVWTGAIANIVFRKWI